MGRGRAPCCAKVGLNKGSWTPQEDMKLVSYIRKYGHSNWRSLPKHAGLLRCGKSCRLRWINYLSPDIKRGNFTKEEEDTIIRLQSSLGNKWSKIASYLPGRTDNEIKNVWNTHLKKKLSSKDANQTSGETQSSSSSVTTTSVSNNCDAKHDHNENTSKDTTNTLVPIQPSDDNLVSFIERDYIEPYLEENTSWEMEDFDRIIPPITSPCSTFVQELQVTNPIISEETCKGPLMEPCNLMDIGFDLWNVEDPFEWNPIPFNESELINVREDKDNWMEELERDLGLLGEKQEQEQEQENILCDMKEYPVSSYFQDETPCFSFSQASLDKDMMS